MLQAMSSQPAVCAPEPLDSEDLLFLLYTSGSTGKPKGVVHTQAGYLLYASLTHQVLVLFLKLSVWSFCGTSAGERYLIFPGQKSLGQSSGAEVSAGSPLWRQVLTFEWLQA